MFNEDDFLVVWCNEINRQRYKDAPGSNQPFLLTREKIFSQAYVASFLHYANPDEFTSSEEDILMDLKFFFKRRNFNISPFFGPTVPQAEVGRNLLYLAFTAVYLSRDSS